MSRAVLLPPAARLSGFYATIFFVTGIQLPFWPLWLAGRGLTAREIGLLLAAAIWAKVLVTPAIGAIADRSTSHRTVAVVLAATALAAFAGLWSMTGFWPFVLLNLVGFAAQSALMPLGETVTLAVVRSGRLDYGRIRVWGSISFILASVIGGCVLASAAADSVLFLVLGGSTLVLLVCLGIPQIRRPMDGPDRLSAIRAVGRNLKFWKFVVAASALQASHQVYYGFATLYWRSLGLSETTIGLLWAEGVLAEILLFWQGRHLLARLGPVGLMMLGGAAGILRWSLTGELTSLPAIGTLQLLHAFTFGASHLGAMHWLSRAVPRSAAASAQSLYAAVSAGLGSGVVMIAAGALYAAFAGRAFLFMALLSAAGLMAVARLGRAAAEAPEPERSPRVDYGGE
jgi:PPP family 3-phenylpropionic acid transporter